MSSLKRCPKFHIIDSFDSPDQGTLLCDNGEQGPKEIDWAKVMLRCVSDYSKCPGYIPLIDEMVKGIRSRRFAIGGTVNGCVCHPLGDFHNEFANWNMQGSAITQRMGRGGSK